MKNVIVLALRKKRYALELRWVREVFTLDHVTRVPRSPDAIAGVANFRGAIIPVLDLEALLPLRARTPHARQAGVRKTAIVIETDRLVAALQVDNVEEVATLTEAPSRPDELIDTRGDNVPLLSPPALLQATLDATLAAVEARRGKPF